MEPFQRAKLEAGIRKACEKRPVTPEAVEAVVDAVEDTLKTRNVADVPSTEIGELVCDHLRALDEVAYLRFASVYKDFRDAEHFEEELRMLKSTE